MSEKVDSNSLDLFNVLSGINDSSLLRTFLVDLCTPQELDNLRERWKVCLLLSEQKLSYREIHRITGASLTTIGRVAKVLSDSRNCGYTNVLKLFEGQLGNKQC